ncbi:Transcription factor E2F4 [Brachionus plicatilis]|uniref:Transcription factor E2F4 n=1 Tax=Brachionus plicatilis TaxID=10195 RepID=A0A3M7QJH4_BRAPC|nr:Transcription factor E2F4 [Brachionus plicatilis]
MKNNFVHDQKKSVNFILKKNKLILMSDSVTTKSSGNIPRSSAASTSSNTSSQSSSSFMSKNLIKLDQKIPKNQSLASYARAEKSLTALTTKFMTLLQECEDGILDLRSWTAYHLDKKDVYTTLPMYWKASDLLKNTQSIQSDGGGPQTNSAETYAQLNQLKSEVDNLDKLENSLDSQIKLMQENKNLLLSNEQNKKNCFVSVDDILKACPGDAAQTIILAKLNKDTVVEVPEPSYVYENSGVKQKYHLNIKDSLNPIDVFLCNQKNDLNEDPDTNEELVLLTPGPSSKDYLFTMDKQEGLIDMFDINLE